MNFQITSNNSNKCPKCKRKLLVILTRGVKKLICSCGYEYILDNYSKNILNTKNISKS